MTTYSFDIPDGMICEASHGYSMEDDGYLHPNPCQELAIICREYDEEKFYVCATDNEFYNHLAATSDRDV